MNAETIKIYTDGACSGNPGPGGWAAIILSCDTPTELSGTETNTTNNRMEMLAAIQALEYILPVCIASPKCVIYSDSAYLINAFNQGWLEKWQKNGWRTAKKTRVENCDLWKTLLEQINVIKERGGKIQFEKVQGHSDDALNNKCDKLARAAIYK